jgi:hypothetical protein
MRHADVTRIAARFGWTPPRRLKDTMPLSHRRAPRLVVVLAALAVGLLATTMTVASARDRSAPPTASIETQDGEPRNPAAEAATGDTDAMLAVVQDMVDCLREKGFDPGDPRVVGKNVVIADWYPAWDSPAGRTDRECGFPVR